MAWLMPVTRNRSLVIQHFAPNVVELVEKPNLLEYRGPPQHFESFDNLKFFKYLLISGCRFSTPLIDVRF